MTSLTYLCSKLSPPVPERWDGKAALRAACVDGDCDAVSTYLRLGAEPWACHAEVAARAGHLDVLRTLLKALWSDGGNAYQSTLKAAYVVGRTESLKLVLATGTDYFTCGEVEDEQACRSVIMRGGLCGTEGGMASVLSQHSPKEAEVVRVRRTRAIGPRDACDKGCRLTDLTLVPHRHTRQAGRPYTMPYGHEMSSGWILCSAVRARGS